MNLNDTYNTDRWQWTPVTHKVKIGKGRWSVRHMSRLLASVLEAPGADYLEKPRIISFKRARSAINNLSSEPVSEQHLGGGAVLLSGKL